MDQEISFERLVAARDELIERRRTLRKAFDNADAELSSGLELVDNAIISKLNLLDKHRYYFEDGTCVHRTTDLKAECHDYGALYGEIIRDAVGAVFSDETQREALVRHIVNNGKWALLQKRVGRNAVVDEIKERLPPTVNTVDYFNGSRDPRELPPIPEVPGVKLRAEYKVQVKRRNQ